MKKKATGKKAGSRRARKTGDNPPHSINTQTHPDGDAAKQFQLMQKTLTEMNLKLQHVFSDIDGVSAQAIIDAILAGERDAKKLAALRDKRSRSSAEDIIEALRGEYRAEYLFVLGQSQRTYDEQEAFKLTPQSEARRRKALEKQAAALGFTLSPAA